MQNYLPRTQLRVSVFYLGRTVNAQMV